MRRLIAEFRPQGCLKPSLGHCTKTWFMYLPSTEVRTAAAASKVVTGNDPPSEPPFLHLSQQVKITEVLTNSGE